MNITEQLIQSSLLTSTLSERYPEYNEAAAIKAQNLVRYLVSKDSYQWNAAANILHVEKPSRQQLDDAVDLLQTPVVETNGKYGQIYSLVYAQDGHEDVAVGMKWRNGKNNLVMAKIMDIYFLFFNYNPYRKDREQYNELMWDYLYFNERKKTKRKDIYALTNNNQLTQLIFNWQHYHILSSLSESRVTFYRYDEMNLPNQSFYGGTFITTNCSIV